MTDENKAEEYIISKYKLNECYVEDTEETRVYMRNKVHSEYQQEYECYLDGLAEGRKENEINAVIANAFHEKNLILEKENAELKEKIKHRNCVDCSNHGKQIEVMKLKKENKLQEEEIEKLNQKEWEDADTIAHMASTIAELEEVNAKLKVDGDDLQKELDELKERIENICSQYVSNELAYKIKEIIRELAK